MAERPILEQGLDSEIFREFYYLKEELVNLFDVQVPAINKHLNNIYSEEEINYFHFGNSSKRRK